MTSPIDAINAALNLNRRHLAGCSEERLSEIEAALDTAGVTYLNSLNPRLVLSGDPSLLQLLTAEVFDSGCVVAALVTAKLTQGESNEVRQSREQRLADLGYVPLTEEDREMNLLIFELYG